MTAWSGSSPGNEVRERLVDVDEDHRRPVYTVVKSPLGRSTRQASVEVLVGGTGVSRLVWISDGLADQLAPTVEGMMALGASAIARTLGG